MGPGNVGWGLFAQLQKIHVKCQEKAKVNIVKIDVHQCQNWRPLARGGVVGKLNNARLFQM